MSGRISRMTISQRDDPPQVRAQPSELTPWYSVAEFTPSRVGAYRLSLEHLKNKGHAYLEWDGKRWLPLGDWADYSTSADAVWQGLAQQAEMT